MEEEGPECRAGHERLQPDLRVGRRNGRDHVGPIPHCASQCCPRPPEVVATLRADTDQEDLSQGAGAGDGVRRHLTGTAGGTFELEVTQEVVVVTEVGGTRTDDQRIVARNDRQRDDLGIEALRTERVEREGGRPNLRRQSLRRQSR